jgi:DNA-binding response OmpR family regulator
MIRVSERMVHKPASRSSHSDVRAAASILLVEDDVSLRRSLMEFLKDSGYHPYSVGTMAEAWPAVIAVKPAVCLLDLNLPDGSGLDLLRRIVAEKLSVRVIVMTAFPLQHLQPAYPSATLAGWLTKPVPPGVLLEAINRAMATGDGATE